MAEGIVAEGILDSTQIVFARERRQQISQIVEAHGRARVIDLAVRFGVTPATIRKDLLILEGDQKVLRAHGGAMALTGTRSEAAFEVRERLQRDDKSRIGAAAAARIGDGESVALDASTSALYVARRLKDRERCHELTVVTNGIRIASELAGHPGISVLMVGGRVRWGAFSVVGPLGSGVFRRVNIQKAFVGAAGFTIGAGLSDATEEEAQTKRAMVAAAREVYALVDHTKWGRVSSATFCRVDRPAGVITDIAAPREIVDALRAMGIQVQQVSNDVDPHRRAALALPGDFTTQSKQFLGAAIALMHHQPAARADLLPDRAAGWTGLSTHCELHEFVHRRAIETGYASHGTVLGVSTPLGLGA